MIGNLGWVAPLHGRPGLVVNVQHDGLGVAGQVAACEGGRVVSGCGRMQEHTPIQQAGSSLGRRAVLGPGSPPSPWLPFLWVCPDDHMALATPRHVSEGTPEPSASWVPHHRTHRSSGPARPGPSSARQDERTPQPGLRLQSQSPQVGPRRRHWRWNHEVPLPPLTRLQPRSRPSPPCSRLGTSGLWDVSEQQESSQRLGGAQHGRETPCWGRCPPWSRPGHAGRPECEESACVAVNNWELCGDIRARPRPTSSTRAGHGPLYHGPQHTARTPLPTHTASATLGAQELLRTTAAGDRAWPSETAAASRPQVAAGWAGSGEGCQAPRAHTPFPTRLRPLTRLHLHSDKADRQAFFFRRLWGRAWGPDTKADLHASGGRPSSRGPLPCMASGGPQTSMPQDEGLTELRPHMRVAQEPTRTAR